MSAPDLLRRLDDLGATLNCDEGRLRYSSPAGKLPPDLVTALKLHRDDLMALVTGRSRLARRPTHDDTGRERGAPLTWTQQTIWATDYFREDGTYNLTGALRLRGSLDEAALHAALTGLQARHPSLRTVFKEERGEPRQHILPPAEPTLLRRDLSDLDPAAALAACLDECADLAARRLPLDTAPPVRQSLYRLAEDDHVFFVVLHHVIADGVSLGVLLDDLAHCYNASRTGVGAGPPPSEIDMIDYVRWEEDVHRYADTSSDRSYWQGRLDGAVLGPLPLPPAKEPVPGGGVVSASVDATTTGAVRALAVRSGASPFTVVSAAVCAALLRYTGRDDFVAGVPVARRDREGLAGLVGLLLDMVPVRMDLSGNPTFRELVGRTRKAVLGAVGHALPAARTSAPSTAGDTAARTPFHVVLTDAGSDASAPRFDGLDAGRLDVAQTSSKYDLNFLLRDHGDTLGLDVEFNRENVSERDVRALVAMVRRILARGSAAPDQAAADLAAAPFGEAAAGALGAAADLAPQDGETLVGRLSGIARERGDAVAISHDGATISYHDLDRDVGRIGLGLHRRGIGPGDVVAIALPRGIDLPLAMLGIMASGAACVVLDDSWPQSRAEQVLADAGVRYTVADEPSPDRDRVTVAQLAQEGSDGAALPPVPSSAVAYVVFTSGSTGRPKGVQVSHRNVLSLLDGVSGTFGFGPEDTWSLFHSCSFDVSVFEIFGCLLHGGRLVVVPKWITREPEAFALLLRRERVTVLSQTPSALSVMLPAIARQEGATAHLRLIIFAGEALERRLYEQWYETFGGQTRLVNMYGTTETTVHASWHWLRPDEGAWAESEIGTPLPGTALHVLHRNGTPALDRCVGEIHIGGSQVSLGYIGRPRETALRFVPDPHSPVPGARMYRSGDFGRRGTSGLTYLGRQDGQVQINGFRVELSEIETALAARPGVAAAAAAVTSGGGIPRIVAAVVPDGSAELSVPDLLRNARGALPVYMAPHTVYIAPELPLTVNGKLDRAAVAAGGDRAAEPAGPAPQPVTDEEKLLLGLAREVLGDGTVLSDDFFALGGDSMRAIRLVGLAHDRGLSLQVKDVYAAPQLRELANRARLAPLAEGTLRRSDRVPFSGVQGGGSGFAPDVVDAYPMTALQSGMIYHREIAPESGIYHIVLSYRVGGPMDDETFRAAVEDVMDRHPTLRTSFDLGHAQGPMQQVHAPVAAPVRFEDISALPPEERTTRIEQVVQAETADDFDLSHPPLFRLVVLTRSPDDYQVIFSHHHAILDGWSVNIFFEDLNDRYKRRLAGEAGDFPALKTTPADAVDLEQRAAGNTADREFWRARTSDPAPLLAPDRPAQPAMRQLHAKLPDGTILRLTSAAQQAGVPLKALLQAAHFRVLSWLTGNDDVVTGLTSLCRPETADSDRMLGLFLNELPMRIQLGAQSWNELARQIHAEEIDMMGHRWYPHALIQQNHGSRPILDVNFNFTDFHTSKSLVRAGGVEVLDVQEIESNHYPLGVNYTVDVRTEELRLLIEYDAASVTRRTAELAAEAHRRVLAAIAADPSLSCRTATLPGVAEQARGAEPQAGPQDTAPPALAAADDRESQESRPLTGAAADLAHEIRQVWAEVLGDGHYDDRDRFFDVGGSSLTAMQVVSRLRARHGALSMGTFMEAPTIAALARLLQASGAASAGPPATAAAVSASGARRYPLSAAQHQMWLLAQRLPGLPLFGMPGALRASGPLDIALLERTFAVLTRRHEALRTRIEATDGVPEQIVEPTVDIAVETVDLSGEPDPSAACERAVAAAAREPFALDSAPLLRVIVHRTADDEHVIFLNVHHIVCDGWSMGLLLDEASRVYRDLAEGLRHPDAPAPLGSGQLQLARAEWLASPEADRQRAYWAERLAGPWPSLMEGSESLLTRKGRAGFADGLRLAGCRTRIPATTVAALREAGRRHLLTDFTTVFAAYASALSIWSGRKDIRVGTMVANRLQPGSDETVGLVANTVVLRLDADTDAAGLALRARQACNEAYDNQELPFEEVFEELGGRSAQREGDGALFEVMLVMQEEARPTDPGSGLGLSPYVPSDPALGRPVAPTTADFVLAVTPIGGELELELLYKPKVFDARDATTLLDDVVAAAQRVVCALEARA